MQAKQLILPLEVLDNKTGDALGEVLLPLLTSLNVVIGFMVTDAGSENMYVIEHYFHAWKNYHVRCTVGV